MLVMDYYAAGEPSVPGFTRAVMSLPLVEVRPTLTYIISGRETSLGSGQRVGPQVGVREFARIGVPPEKLGKTLILSRFIVPSR